MKFIAAAFGDNIDHAAGGAAVFRVVVAQNELKLLHAFLRNRRANAVDGVVPGVRAVHADHVPACACTPDAQAAVGRRTDGGRDVARGLGVGKREIDVVAPIDRQVVDAALLDGIGDFRLGRLDGRCFRGNGHGLLHAFKFQAWIKGGALAYCVAAVIVRDRRPRPARGGIRQCHLCAFDAEILRIKDRPGKSRRVDLRRDGRGAAEYQQNEQNSHEDGPPGA